MRKIVTGLFVSLDGVYGAPDRWHFPWFDDEMGAAVQAQIDAADAMLLGRVTWQEFAAYWPRESGAEAEIGGHINTTPKFVVSNTLEGVDDWQNSTLVKGNVAEELTRLKRQPGKNIGVTGSGTLVCSLLRDGLLDELRLFVHPIVVGRGKRLFPDGIAQQGLKLADSQTFGTGTLYLTYEPAGR